MRYEFDVLECGVNPPSPRPSIYDEPLVSGKCFYLVSSGADGEGSKLALEVAEQEKYFPQLWGIFNIGLADYKGKSSDFKPQ